MRQKEEEDLRTYYERCASSYDVVENYNGSIGKENDVHEQNDIYNNLSATNKQEESKIEEARAR